MIAYGEFHGDGVLGDLAKLKLTDEQASAYANAKPGDALNLSSDEVASREGPRQAIVGFLPVPEGTLVVYTNHTSTDQVAGFGGGAKRSIGRRFMASQLEGLFQKTRAASGR